MRSLPLLKPFALAATLMLSAQAAPEQIDYSFTPVVAQGALRAVEVDLRFRGEADGQTLLRLPQSWGGRDQLWRAITDLEAVSGARLSDGEGPGQRVLTHRPGARVHVRYRIVQDYEGAPSAREGNAYRAVVQPGYFHLIGEAAMVTPEGADDATPVRFRMRRLPRGWRFASDLEHADLTLGDVWSSISVGGDFRILEGAAPNLRIAIRGDWSWSDADFIATVDRVIAGHRRFWDDAGSPYLVTVLQTEQPQPGWLSIGGTGLGDAFAFFATPNAEAAPITRTLAHESLHTWIPLEIGGAPEEGEALQYWLSEGFTEFYTGRLLVREGIWTPQDFADDLNTMLRAYAFSSAREAPNARIGADFWTNQDVQQMPYQRGRLMATIWDARLRAQGQSLDELMHTLRDRVDAGVATRPAGAEFAALAFELMDGFSPDYENHIIAGHPVLLPPDVFAPCGRVATFEAAPFHRGFDIEATSANNNTITGLDPSSPAYAAGLRDGMVILRRDGGVIGDAEQELIYVLRDGDAERTIRYFPRGPGVRIVQRLDLAAPLQGEVLAQCVRVLGGQ